MLLHRLIPASRPSQRFVCLTGMALVTALGLGGCTNSTAMQAQPEALAFQSFTETLSADMYAAIAPAAGEAREPLIEALAGLAPEGKTFAFADDININMLVPVAKPGMSAVQRRAEVLAAAGLKATDAGSVLYIQRGTAQAAEMAAPVSAPAPAAPAATADRYSDAYSPQLTSSTMMSAPLLSGGESVPSSAPVATAPAPVLRSVATGEEVTLASTVRTPAPVLDAPSTTVMPKAEETMANIEPAAAPVMLTAENAPEPLASEPAKVVSLPDDDVTIVPQLPVVAPEVARSVETNPTVIAAADANDRSVMGLATGIASEPVAANGFTSDTWQAERGQTLRTVLEGWCSRADVQLVWGTDFDYPLAASVTLNDSFENAVRTLLSGFGAVSPQPFGRLHRQGNAGQRVLIVETRGNLYQDQ